MNKVKSLILLILITGFSWNHSISQNMNLDWQIGYHKTENEPPVVWYASTIPGAVQLDVMKAENYKQPWWYADNVRQFDWMEDVWFTYRTHFNRPPLQKGERVYFFSKGVDYQFKIYLNQKLLWEQEGMFTYVDVDLTDNLKEQNELIIVLLPVPKLGFKFEDDPGAYRKNAQKSAKPAVSYGWDWHPRLVTRGIWDETSLIVRKSSYISDVAVDYELNENLTGAKVQATLEGVQLQNCYVRWIMKDPQGKIALDKQEQLTTGVSTIKAELSDIQLWWPSGYGLPQLYTNEFILLDSDLKEMEKYSGKTGFRKIRLIMNEGAWDREGGFPKSRAFAPASIEVNHRRIFAKGSNWVHPDIFVGAITPERYREQILLAKNANFNILRVWGGGIVNKEAFFDICDELGILVWQEFPLACNNYTDDIKYLKVLEQEARSIIKRVKKHACLVLWSGGNELFNSWSGMTEQSLALRLLNSLCYQLDPQTPFIYTSPIYGVGHGHYVFYDASINEDVFQWMAKADKTAYTEYGVPSVANLDVLKSFIPENELFPPKRNTAWKTHHAYDAWGDERWMELPVLQKYFREIKTLEELVKYSQLLQCEGLKFIYEEARRQKPFCSMALNWCYQEPWPSAANNSLINWYNEIKPAYHHVANACRPVLASVRIPKFAWKEGEDFTCDLLMLNDTYEQLASEKVKVIMQFDGMEKELITWNCPGSDGFINIQGPTVKTKIPHMKTNLFSIRVCVEGKPQYNSIYILLFSGKNVQKSFPSEEYYQGK